MKQFCRVAFVLLAIAIPARADVIYNTFGPDYAVGNASILIAKAPYYEAVAAPFTPFSAVNVTQIDLGLYAYAQVNNLEVDLMAEVNGLPDRVVESWSLHFEGSYQEHISTLVGNAFLEGGSRYWIAVTATDNQTDMGWIDSYVATAGWEGFNFGNGWNVFPNGIVPAFDVIGTPVPEPGTLMLFGTAVFGLSRLLRGKFNL